MRPPCFMTAKGHDVRNNPILSKALPALASRPYPSSSQGGGKHRAAPQAGYFPIILRTARCSQEYITKCGSRPRAGSQRHAKRRRLWRRLFAPSIPKLRTGKPSTALPLPLRGYRFWAFSGPQFVCPSFPHNPKGPHGWPPPPAKSSAPSRGAAHPAPPSLRHW